MSTRPDPTRVQLCGGRRAIVLAHGMS